MAETINILLLGTGLTGASIGLALRRAGGGFQRIGFDPHPPTAREAQQAGAVDKLVNRPSSVASEADLVLLNLPAAEALAYVDAIAERLKPDTVVLSTVGLQDVPMQPVRAHLAPKNLCLGAIPFLGPRSTLTSGDGPAEAAADRFDEGMLGIVAPPGTPEGAIQICTDLAAILNATPFFLEPAEVDSVTATSDELPSVLATALLESLPANPGWRDQRRLVGRSFAQIAGLLEGRGGDDLAGEWISNRRPLAARLEAFAQELEELRAALDSADEADLKARLERAIGIYQEWHTTRRESRLDHGPELPGLPRVNLFDRLVGRRERPSPKKA